MPYDQSPESKQTDTFSEIQILMFSVLDIEAAQHALDVAIGWFADPIYLGHYPPYLRELLGDRALDFTPEEWTVVKGSSDFYGMNTYTTNLCRAGGDDEFQGNVDYTFERPDGTQLGTQGLP